MCVSIAVSVSQAILKSIKVKFVAWPTEMAASSFPKQPQGKRVGRWGTTWGMLQVAVGTCGANGAAGWWQVAGGGESGNWLWYIRISSIWLSFRYALTFAHAPHDIPRTAPDPAAAAAGARTVARDPSAQLANKTPNRGAGYRDNVKRVYV